MLFLSFTLVLVSCKKDTDAIKVADSPQVYTNSNGTSVSLTNSKWVTTKYVDGDNSFGNVLLSLFYYNLLSRELMTFDAGIALTQYSNSEYTAKDGQKYSS